MLAPRDGCPLMLLATTLLIPALPSTLPAEVLRELGLHAPADGDF
jgi:hypothetical protein